MVIQISRFAAMQARISYPHSHFTHTEEYDAIIISKMAAQDPNNLNIPVLHHNKQIHVLLFILVCVLVAGFTVYFTMILPSQKPPEEDDSYVQVLEAQKQQAFQEIKAQISTAPPISQQQKNQAFEQIKRIKAQQEI